MYCATYVVSIDTVGGCHESGGIPVMSVD